ncbi:MAG: glutamine synthetase, partial [Candidatus Margulisbacteria bacterium]|nr:glutamine synthetase [Candidatus Margulisiibacteriota bacterium]
GQWEFQIGYRGFDEPADALKTTDDLGYATWLLHRLSEDYDIKATYDNKPIKGDWNGAGCHTNFSTKDMRDPKMGRGAVQNAIKELEKNHKSHIEIYGHNLSDRLTGAHETCDINTFRAGDSDRGASIRIPVATTKKGYGYIEDRRPGANSDPYLVAARILATVCGIEIEAFSRTQSGEKEGVLI